MHINSNIHPSWVVTEKNPYSAHRGNSAAQKGGGKKLFLIIINVLGHLKGVEGGVTSFFSVGVV
jgi:hypothetical protein